MSNIKTHRRITKRAYRLLSDNLKDKSFPKYWKISLYDRFLNPDIIDVTKFIKGYDRKNHLNSENRKQSIERVKKHFDHLVKSLEKGVGSAKDASWLSHFIVDSLEPAHLIEWKVPDNRKKSLSNLKYHRWLERRGKKSKIQTYNSLLKNLDVSVTKYLEKVSDDLRLLPLMNFYPYDPKLATKIYEKDIIPQQIRLVASIWYKALVEARS